MLNILLCLLCLILPGATPAPVPAPDQPAVAPAQPVQELQKRPAEMLIASLTKYYIGVFWTGPKWTASSEQEIRDRMKKNVAQIKELVKSGKLVGMAAVQDSSDCKMLVFFKTDSEQEARTIAENSYAVKEGLLRGDIHQVWGTRGLGEGLKKEMKENPKKILKKETYYLTILSKGKAWKEKPDEKMLPLVDVHASNVLKLRESGVLKFYGAVDGSGTIRNISIVKAQSVKDVQMKLAAGDLVKNEWFSPSVYRCTIPEGTLP